MTLHRRHLLVAGFTLPLIGAGARPAWGAPPMPPIRPRAEWAGRLVSTGPLQAETDVRFLLVHHSETPNGDLPQRTPERLRGIYAYHTGPQKRWPDVAYNFFVDGHGVIWEGRAGSLAGPIRGDATGGSQGCAELVCFVGDHSFQPPTSEAMAAMAQLLAWLAGRDRLDLAGPITFTSRGSNRWRSGTSVTTEQIAGHRQMSQTACPGDALFPLIASRLLPEARILLAGGSRTPTPAPAPSSATPSPEAASADPEVEPDPAAASPKRPEEALRWAGGVATVTGLAGIGASAWWRRRRPAAALSGSGDELEHDEGGADSQRGQEGDQESP